MSMFSLRMDDQDYRDLRAMSLVTGRSMAELVRTAIEDALKNFGLMVHRDQTVLDELRRRQQAVEILEQRALAVLNQGLGAVSPDGDG